MNPSLQSLGEAASLASDLVPFLAAPLILLLLWEVVLLLAAILGMRSKTGRGESRHPG